MLRLVPIAAQTDCGVADRLDFPVDRSLYTLVQGFSVPSVRHQGRLHTGEDWVGGRGATVGQSVRAIADGRVTYSSPTAWGRDGGVVIIEHTFSDGTQVNSMYGHINDAGAPFPQRYTCVQLGQVIGTIAEGVRPAPHLHFEIRTTNPDTPGAGYQTDTSGYLAGSAFIVNEQTWLRPSSAFHTAIAAGLRGAPAVLDDFSLLYLDNNNNLRRALPDGRILWRNRLETPAAAVIAWQRQSLLVMGDGRFQVIDVETGSLSEGWRIKDFAPVGAPFDLGSYLVFPTAGDTLTALDEQRRALVWQVADIPAYTRTTIANPGVNAIIGLLTTQDEVLQVAGSGVVISRQALRHAAALGSNAAGDLLVFAWGGLYAVDTAGDWQPALEVGKGGASAALWRGSEGLLTFDGQTLRAFDNTNTPLWTVTLSGVTGSVSLARYEGTVALVSSGGTLATVNSQGVVCNQTQVAPQRHSLIWQTLSADGIWRLAAADHLIGINWQRFNQGCGG